MNEDSINDIKEIKEYHILNFLKTMNPNQKASINWAVYVLRSFFRELYRQNIIDVDYSQIIPKTNYKSQSKLPSMYTEHEISHLLKDVNLIDNYIIVKDSKNGEERSIPISSSLSAVCEEYLSYREKLPIGNNAPGSYFFVSLNGNRLLYMSVGVYFRKVLAKAGIPYIGKQKGPRIHDLRHTFACHALRSMAESGIDMYCSLPILSTYLVSCQSSNDG